MIYKNYLTTPSGKMVFIRELLNKDFIILTKYLQGDNYEYFYKNLDNFIKQDIKDFDDFDILDKAYIYFAICFYYVHASFVINTNNYGSTEISVASIIDVLDNCKAITYFYTLKDGIDIEIGLPKKLIFSDTNRIQLDYISGLNKVNNITLTKRQRDNFSNIASKYLISIENNSRAFFIQEVDLFEKNIKADELKINIFSSDIFYFIASIFKEDLKSYYEKIYYAINYLKLSFDDFKNMTPVEIDIMFNNYTADKKQQQEKVGNKVGVYDERVGEALGF